MDEAGTSRPPWCRYADDGLVHCRTEQEAEAVKAALQARLAECQLEMHPSKTKIVYCKTERRKGSYPNVTFDFLGYCFRPRSAMNARSGRSLPATSVRRSVPQHSTKCARQSGTWASGEELRCRWRTSLRTLNPLLRGWERYYGRYTSSALGPLYRYVNQTLAAWARRKFKRFKGSRTQAGCFLQKLAQDKTDLCALATWYNRLVCLMGAV